MRRQQPDPESTFVPEGYLRLPDALGRCAEVWKAEQENAWRRMREKLHSGALPSYYVQNSGVVQLLAITHNTGRYSTGAHSWGNKLNDRADQDGLIRFFGVEGSWSSPAYIKESELEFFLDGKTIEPSLSLGVPSATQHGRPPAQSSQNRGGAPRKFDWDSIWIEVCRIIHSEGVPSTQADLIRQIQDWYENKAKLGTAPEASTLKPLVRRLWDTLDREG